MLSILCEGIGSALLASLSVSDFMVYVLFNCCGKSYQQGSMFALFLDAAGSRYYMNHKIVVLLPL